MCTFRLFVFFRYLHFPFKCYKQANSASYVALITENVCFIFVKVLILLLSRFLVGLQERIVLVLIYFKMSLLRAGFNNIIHLS